jgi:hypothetical protein
MVALTDSPEKVASAIENAGGRAIISHFDSIGVKQE